MRGVARQEGTASAVRLPIHGRLARWLISRSGILSGKMCTTHSRVVYKLGGVGSAQQKSSQVLTGLAHE